MLAVLESSSMESVHRLASKVSVIGLAEAKSIARMVDVNLVADQAVELRLRDMLGSLPERASKMVPMLTGDFCLVPDSNLTGNFFLCWFA